MHRGATKAIDYHALSAGRPGPSRRRSRPWRCRCPDLAWADVPEDLEPLCPVGSAPGQLLPWGSSASGETVFFRIPAKEGEEWRVGVVEHDEGTYEEDAMTFSEWMLAYLRGQDDTVCSRNFAPDGPFYRRIRWCAGRIWWLHQLVDGRYEDGRSGRRACHTSWPRRGAFSTRAVDRDPREAHRRGTAVIPATSRRA